MSDKATVSTSVDTFNDGGSYYVRTEIEARLVGIHGPFPDLDTAKRLQAEQAAYAKTAGDQFKASYRALRPPRPRARPPADAGSSSPRRSPALGRGRRRPVPEAMGRGEPPRSAGAYFEPVMPTAATRPQRRPRASSRSLS